MINLKEEENFEGEIDSERYGSKNIEIFQPNQNQTFLHRIHENSNEERNIISTKELMDV